MFHSGDLCQNTAAGIMHVSCILLCFQVVIMKLGIPLEAAIETNPYIKVLESCVIIRDFILCACIGYKYKVL